MKSGRQRLTLGRPVTYQIQVPGHLDKSWSDWVGGMTIPVASWDSRNTARRGHPLLGLLALVPYAAGIFLLA